MCPGLRGAGKRLVVLLASISKRKGGGSVYGAHRSACQQPLRPSPPGRKAHSPGPEKCHSSRWEEAAGDKPTPLAPSPHPRKASHPAQGPLGLLASSPYTSLAPLPCSSLSRSQGCPHQEYLLTRLALLATLTTNMLSDKVGRKKLVVLKTMSETTAHPRRGREGRGRPTGHPGRGHTSWGGFCHTLSLFSFLFYFPPYRLLPGDPGLGMVLG